MFPIRFDFPFRKANGDLSTIGAEISSGGGGGGGYTLPTASAETKGGVKIGAGLSMEGETLVNNNPTPATPYTLPTASAETLGGVKVGTGLAIDENGVLSASGGGGGSSKYLHHFCIGNTLSGTYLAFNAVLDTSNKFDLTNSPTYTKLTAFLLAHGYSVNDSFPASGVYRDSENIRMIVSVIINATSLSAMYPNGSTTLSSGIISSSYYEETVISL